MEIVDWLHGISRLVKVELVNLLNRISRLRGISQIVTWNWSTDYMELVDWLHGISHLFKWN